MKAFLYKARKSLFSCFLITTAIGWTYAFSFFSQPAQERLGVSRTAVQFAPGFALIALAAAVELAFFGVIKGQDRKKDA